jgi:2'-5' RNA ligase
MEIRFAVIPPEPINKKVSKLATQLAARGKHRFVVDNRNYFPHITLFKMEVPPARLRALLTEMQVFAKKFPTFPVKISSFGGGGGWLDLQLAHSSQLDLLRRKLAEVVSQVLQEKVLLTSSYRPHVTMIRFYSEKKKKEAMGATDSLKCTMKVSIIGLCLSRQTQVYKIIHKVRLS